MLVDRATLLQPNVPRTLCVLLILLMIGQIYSDTKIFLALNKSIQPPSSIPIQQKHVNKQNALTNSLKIAFFGDFVPKNITDAAVKQSMLNLTVVGIMFSTNEKVSQVIIRAAGGNEKIYKVGDTLPGDVVIKRITTDGVLINRHGALESLSLSKDILTFEPLAKPMKDSSDAE